MQQKFDNNQYESLEKFSEDFELICSNAMLYYPTKSNLYQKASQFKRYGTMLMSQGNIGCFGDKVPVIPKIIKDPHIVSTPSLLKSDDLKESSDADSSKESIMASEEASNTKSPLTRLLIHLLSSLQKKDADGYFAKPVTEKIAPRYFELIKNPMDFATMKSKLREEVYETFKDFVSDFDQICNNARLYNLASTLVYKKASDLKKYGTNLLSKYNIRSLKEKLPYLSDIPQQKLGFALVSSASNKIQSPTKENSNTPALKSKESKRTEPPSKSIEEAYEMSEYEKLRARNIEMRKQMMANVIQESME